MKKKQLNEDPRSSDLPDSENDKRHMEKEEFTLDLPEVKDIPGQEHVRPLPAKEMADTTIASADEEGDELFADESEINTNDSGDVSPLEAALLRESAESMGSQEDEDIKNALVDNTDTDGTALNEKSTRSGKDLDVPGSEDDDEDEEIGEEDEENNSFSLPDQGKD